MLAAVKATKALLLLLLLQVLNRAPDELLDPEHCALYARLRVGVVVLDALQQLAQAPVAVSLHVKHDGLQCARINGHQKIKHEAHMSVLPLC
jgi:hypothetical protein